MFKPCPRLLVPIFSMLVRGCAVVLVWGCASTVPSQQEGQQAALAQSGGDPPEAAAVTPDPWPKTITQGGATYTLYQPQLDSWDGHNIAAHAAVSVRPDGAKEADFGVIEITAQTYVSKQSRTVDFADLAVTKATFPATPDKAAGYQQNFQTIIAGGPSTMSLDRLQALLAHRGTVPINWFVQQLLKIDRLPVAFQVGVRYYAEQPEGGPDWGLRFATTLLCPK
jgi:hypothetical protein